MSAVKPLRIGIVAGEPSGDILGAGLITALRQQVPELLLEGIGGPKMQSLGFKSLMPMEDLAVGGIFEVFHRLPRLFVMRRHLYRHFLKNPPDVFIGIDAPDFNLVLEKKLKANGIKTVHYVSPTVWAWRPQRILKVKKAADLVLSIFPFEAPLYAQHQIPCVFVGHPLADEIAPPQNHVVGFKQSLNPTYITLLPGSRDLEIKRLGPLFLQTAKWCFKKNPHLSFLLPTVCARHTASLKALVEKMKLTFPLTFMENQSRKAIQMSEGVLTASGTETLECLLFRKPMVVAYRLAPLTYHIVKKMIRVPYCSQPNLLSGKALVPEFLQEDAKPEKMGQKLMELLEDSEHQKNLFAEFEKVHHELRQNANQKAAEAVMKRVNSC